MLFGKQQHKKKLVGVIKRKMAKQKKVSFFIKEAIKKPGSLKRTLEIPREERIPKELLNKIIRAKAGETITNPTKTGKRRVKVTRLVERRAILARNLRSINEKRARFKERRTRSRR